MNDNESNASYRKAASPFGSVLVIAMAMSIYAYIRLARNSVVLTVAILLLTVLEIVRIVLAAKSSRPVDLAFDGAYFLTLLSVLLGVLRTSLSAHPVFLFTTIFYRPNYMLHGNRRFAFVVSLLIIAVVFPITLGLITEPASVDMLTLCYAVLVLSLWMFCSQLGANATRKVANSIN